nr:hypothetical protein [Frankia nepalensis]
MTERKKILLRLDPAVHDALARWAGDELRSTNAQIEFLLRAALSSAGRLPSAVGRMPRRGRPPRSGGEAAGGDGVGGEVAGGDGVGGEVAGGDGVGGEVAGGDGVGGEAVGGDGVGGEVAGGHGVGGDGVGGAAGQGSEAGGEAGPDEAATAVEDGGLGLADQPARADQPGATDETTDETAE